MQLNGAASCVNRLSSALWLSGDPIRGEGGGQGLAVVSGGEGPLLCQPGPQGAGSARHTLPYSHLQAPGLEWGGLTFFPAQDRPGLSIVWVARTVALVAVTMTWSCHSAGLSRERGGSRHGTEALGRWPASPGAPWALPDAVSLPAEVTAAPSPPHPLGKQPAASLVMCVAGLGAQLLGQGLLPGQLAGQLCSPENEGPGNGCLQDDKLTVSHWVTAEYTEPITMLARRRRLPARTRRGSPAALRFPLPRPEAAPCGERPGPAPPDSTDARPRRHRTCRHPSTRRHPPTLRAPLKMPRGSVLLLASLLLAAALSATLGLGSPVKEKRGWTLNSAGYLLGPHAIDNHRSFHDKHGLAGKRELEPEDEARPGSFDRPLADNSVVRTIIEFLTFLHLKDAGVLEHLPGLPTAESAGDAERS
ncbi:hypothetical protein AB1E18_019452 [Capra hircus]